MRVYITFLASTAVWLGDFNDILQGLASIAAIVFAVQRTIAERRKLKPKENEPQL